MSPMTPDATTVIVGSSVGGARTALSLRKAGYQGAVVLVGAESEPPYDKPPLSKAALRDGTDRAICLLTRENAERANVTLELGVPASGLDLASSRVLLADGRELRFDELVIATGAHARPSPWGEPEHLHLLRTSADSRRLRADLLRGGRLVVVGAGFIGAEVASTAAELGLEVSIVDPLPVPMGRVLGEEVGRLFQDLHSRNGVRTHFGVGVQDVHQDGGRLVVVLTDGEHLAADTVVVGIGVRLNDGWLASSGLLLDDGVVCDEYLRAVGQRNVHAVGDIARWRHPGHGEAVRVEHWTNAVEQAACVANNIARPDARRPHAPVEYVWSDQHDWKIQITGRPWVGSAPVVLGDPATDRRFAAVWAGPDGLLCGAMSVNWPKATVRSRRALAAGERLQAVLSDLTDGTR